jgi:hypothetical protein
MTLPFVGPTLWSHVRINVEVIYTFIDSSKVAAQFCGAFGGTGERIFLAHRSPHIVPGE